MKTPTLSILSILSVLAPWLFLPWVSPARAQLAETPVPYITPEYIRQAPTLPPGRDMTRAIRMTIAQAIQTAMRRNLDLNFERENATRAAIRIDEEMGRFEPTLDGNISHLDARRPPETKQEGRVGDVPTFKDDTWRLGLRQPLPLGGSLGLSFSSVLQASTLGTAVLPKIVRTSFNVDLSQPLLRGLSLNGHVQLAQLLGARFASEAALQQARLRAMNVVNDTENSYWTVVRAIKSYEVSTGALDSARKQLVVTQRLITAGTSPGSDLISAESALARSELLLVQADAAVDQAMDGLRARLNLPAEDWDRPILPSDTPSFLPLRVALGPAIEHALAARPELKMNQIELKQFALQQEVLRNARLPSLDLNARYQTVGQDETFVPAFDQLSRLEGRAVSIGATFSWSPLGMAARARIRGWESVLRGNGISRERTEMNIRSEVRLAVRDIETVDRKVLAAARSRELSERSLDVEQRRFINGLSDNFKISTRQDELQRARQAELDALIQHETFVSELQLAMGDLLEARHVRFSIHRAGEP